MLANTRTPPSDMLDLLARSGFPTAATPSTRALLGAVASVAMLRRLCAYPDAEVDRTDRPSRYLRAASAADWPDDFPLGGAMQPLRGDAAPADMRDAILANPALDAAHLEHACHTLRQRPCLAAVGTERQMAASLLTALALLSPPRPDLMDRLLAHPFPHPRDYTARPSGVLLSALDDMLDFTNPRAEVVLPGAPTPQELVCRVPPARLADILHDLATDWLTSKPAMLQKRASNEVQDHRACLAMLALLAAMPQVVIAMDAKTWHAQGLAVVQATRRADRVLRETRRAHPVGNPLVAHVPLFEKMLEATRATLDIAATCPARHALSVTAQSHQRRRA